jgi:hypothetical protein
VLVPTTAPGPLPGQQNPVISGPPRDFMAGPAPFPPQTELGPPEAPHP